MWKAILDVIPGYEVRRGSVESNDTEDRYDVRMQQYRTQLKNLGNAGVAAFTAPLIAFGMLAACALQLLFIVSITGLVHAKHHAQQCSWMRPT